MFRTNFVAVHQQWVERLTAGQQFEMALTVLARGRARMPDEEYFIRAAEAVRERKLAGDLTPPGF